MQRISTMTSRSSLRAHIAPYAVGFAMGFAAAIVCSSARAGEAETIPVPPGTLVVVDGDTVKIGRQRLRLLSIDAPEIQHARCKAERRVGQASKARLLELIDGRTVEIRFSGKDDRYDRPLVDLAVPAGDIGTILMGEGLAVPYRGGRKAWAERVLHWCGGRGSQ
jgi:micrococcal nuclease